MGQYNIKLPSCSTAHQIHIIQITDHFFSFLFLASSFIEKLNRETAGFIATGSADEKMIPLIKGQTKCIIPQGDLSEIYLRESR